MEEVYALSEGDANVRQSGPVEWFETFFDWGFPYEGEREDYPAMAPNEINAVREVFKLMQEAIADPGIPRHPSVEQIIASGWPRRIAPVAKAALDVMLARGRFSEEIEEAEPSSPVPWPNPKVR